jgi:hypothetical protein
MKRYEPFERSRFNRHDQLASGLRRVIYRVYGESCGEKSCCQKGRLYGSHLRSSEHQAFTPAARGVTHVGHTNVENPHRGHWENPSGLFRSPGNNQKSNPHTTEIETKS